MTRRPQLNTVCGRCGKPRGNPLTHTCRTRSDFKARKAAYAKQQQAAARQAKPAHDYRACSDTSCPRPLCVAFKTGYHTGDHDGHADGWQQGYDRGHADGMRQGYDQGHADGINDCPRQHK
ncbi:MAG TPA: hypothetical protein VGM53_31815 [Streptosporangiaceae bacterium]|jgi:hypothetical protein